MATTHFREDFLGRDLQNPGTVATDFLGRAVTATVDGTGRSLRRILRANTTAYTTGTEIAFTTGSKYLVTVGGTSAASQPSVPAVGASIADGSCTILRQA
jgi:hypothetical protein